MQFLTLLKRINVDFQLSENSSTLQLNNYIIPGVPNRFFKGAISTQCNIFGAATNNSN